MQLDPVTGFKTCPDCHVPQLAVDAFGKDKNTCDGFALYCKECDRLRVAAWFKAHPESEMIIRRKRYAKKKSVPFTIKEEDIYIPGNCPLCGCLMKRNEGGRAAANSSPSLDQYDPRLGYIPGNVWVICMSCNRRKQDLTGEGLVAFGMQIIEAFKEACERLGS